MSRVAVIGGGAAGMLAAIAAAEHGHQVQLFEKNEKLGKKIYITGKGRCNVTNACDTEELFAAVVHNPKFLYSSFYSFTNQDMMELVERNGCPLKTERGGRVFPVSDKSSDVIRALTVCLKNAGVQVRLYEEVDSVETRDGRVFGIRLKKTREIVSADALIVATGGLSYPSTGSTGDGYRFAEKTGHTVTDLSPALVPFETAEPVGRDLQGLALKNIQAKILKGKKVLYEEFGEMLFTHFGVSGPVILSASRHIILTIEEGYRLYIDLKPAMDEKKLDARILRDFEKFANKDFANALDALLPQKMIPVIVRLSGIDARKKVNSVTKEERKRLVGLLKALPLTITGTTGYNEAVVTCGGIQVNEIDPATMESKFVKQLHFAGEVLDVDAYTGGFNLQIAFSTGFAAGNAVCTE